MIKKLFVFSLVLVLALVIGVFVFFKSQGLDNVTDYLVKTIKEEVDIDFTFKSVHIAWAKLLQLRPAIAIDSIRIANPRGFKAENIAAIDNVTVELSLSPLLNREIVINNVEINRPEIFIEQNSARLINAIVLAERLERSTKANTKKPKALRTDGKPIKAKKKENKKQAAFFEIKDFRLDRFALNDGKFSFIDYSQKKVVPFLVKDIFAGVTGFSLKESFDLALKANILDHEKQNLNFKGKVGPISANVIPASGDLDIKILLDQVISQMPPGSFQGFVIKTDSSDSLSLNGKFQGDLLKKIFFDGSYELSEIAFGNHENRVLPVSAKGPYSVNVSNLSTIPLVIASAKNTVINIDKGRLSLNSSISLKENYTWANFSGSLTGLKVNKLQKCFSPPGQSKIYGAINIPSFNLATQGDSPEQLQSRLAGEGKVIILDGRLELLEKILSITKKISLAVANLDITKDLAKFTKLSTSVIIKNQKIKTPDLYIQSPIADIYGRGYVAFDQAMRYSIDTKIGSTTIPILIKGTTEKPAVKLNTKAIANKQKEKIKGAATKELNQGLEKLLGTKDTEAIKNGLKDALDGLF